MENRLLLNRAHCTHCLEIITSYHVHDFVRCSCRKIGADGGTQYVKRLFDKPSDYIDLSIYDTENGSHEIRRLAIHWGVNYTKEMVRLPETKWTPIENLEYSHIEAILKTQPLNTFMTEVFETELFYRDLVETSKL